MKRRTFLKSLGVIATGVAMGGLAGCGFHLRGQGEPLGFDRLTLTAPIGELTDSVRRELANADVMLVDDAPLRVNLGPENIQEYTLTAGDTGTQEIELRLTAPFSVQRTRDGAYLLDQQRIEVVTTYLANDDDLLVLGDLREQALEDLRREAARQLLSRLRSLDTP
ncbi:Lipopolysaccharide-assembly [Modicisalibacter muralis]|uniref:LPS-assembly lipoprotein LptE n=1 Tax=Modicisalibacter muralis TaxID=119000 RepID=A0A1G9RAP1_9GAMM|nr:LPS assembly lipoprotein LptE [Halomonas muralis]SDM20221.1 Lipopolysaccharide-assembly [Halomonas muralis]